MRTIVGIDTRALTIALREHGTIAAALAVGDEAIANVERTLTRYVREATTQGLVASVADALPRRRDDRRRRASTSCCVDCGVKKNIIRDLAALDARVTVLPYGATRDEILAREPGRVVVSPGPGDPRDLGDTVETLRG